MTLMNKYIWVVNVLLRAGQRGLSLKEINEKWQRTDFSGGSPIPRQTFDRWKGGISDTLGIVIECELKGGYRYYICNPAILEHGELSRWLLDTYTTADALSQYKVLKDRIITEEIPSNREWLTVIMRAMNENDVIVISYKNFRYDKSYTFPVEPYCLKLFEKRWYLLARSVNEDRLRLYGVDRIEEVNITEKHFVLPDDFDAKDYFSTFFGVVLDQEIKVERIVLRANGHHQYYLRSLPLHPSQKEIHTCEDYADFELELRPTYDFIMELLRVGSMIEVLEPQSLRHQMHEWSKELWEIYKND